ncbi:MAG: hypothetical protein JNK19_03895 [Tabrizicola sp.]|nr:hypothetical protein [Tabrizicola sp.]
MQYFDFIETSAGVTVVPLSDRLTTASLSAKEINSQVQALKEDLDRVAKRMKAAISEPKSLGLHTEGHS